MTVERFAGEALNGGRDVELEMKIDALMKQGLAFEEAFIVATVNPRGEDRTAMLKAMRELAQG